MQLLKNNTERSQGHFVQFPLMVTSCKLQDNITTITVSQSIAIDIDTVEIITVKIFPSLQKSLKLPYYSYTQFLPISTPLLNSW